MMNKEDLAAFKQIAEAAPERCNDSLRKWLDLPEVRDALMRDMVLYGTASFTAKNEGDYFVLEVVEPFHER